MSIMIGIGKNLRITPSGVIPFSYEPELLTYISGLVTPLSDGQLILLNNYILALKSGLGITNLSDVFDVMYILAGETEESSLKNLVKNLHHCTNVHATAFVALEGFTGDGANDYLDTNYNPDTQGSKYTLNNASFGIYSRTNRANSSSKAHGATTAAARCMILPLYTVSNIRGALNTLTYSTYNEVGVTTQGMITVLRSDAANQHIAKNYTIQNFEVASTAKVNQELFLGAYCNAAGSAAYFDDIQLSFCFLGKYLTPAELTSLINAFEAYMDAHGKGVI